MKKFFKISIIIATVLVCLGAILLCISFILGAPKALAATRTTLDLELPKFVQNRLETGHIKSKENTIHINQDYPVLSGDAENILIGNADDIEDVSLTFQSGTLTFKESKDNQIYISYNNCDSFQFYINDHTLTINAFKDIAYFDSIPVNRNQLTVYVPKDFTPENWTIDLAASSVDFSSIKSTDSVSIDFAAGSLMINQLQTDSLSINHSAGECKIKDATISDANIDLAMGKLNLDGLISNDLYAKCSMGDIEFKLNDHFENHNYIIDCSMGDISIFGNSYDGLDKKSELDHQADSTYDLSCAMGSIKIY